jgi:uncharacterized protein affecting Mg2+/Co2+ transport
MKNFKVLPSGIVTCFTYAVLIEKSSSGEMMLLSRQYAVTEAST